MHAERGDIAHVAALVVEEAHALVGNARLLMKSAKVALLRAAVDFASRLRATQRSVEQTR